MEGGPRQPQHKLLRRVSAEALAAAAAARYAAGAMQVEGELLRLAAETDRQASAAHLQNVADAYLALAARSGGVHLCRFAVWVGGVHLCRFAVF